SARASLVESPGIVDAGGFVLAPAGTGRGLCIGGPMPHTRGDSREAPMPDDQSPYIGRSLLRREDRRLLTGQGQFVADIVLPRMAHAVLVRSPVAHARIRSIDLARAKAAPGVLAAISGADLLQMLPRVPEGQISLPRKWQNVVQHKFVSPQEPLLAHDKARHVGEALAIIVAETRNEAEDAAELVTLGLDELEPVVDPNAALRPDAPI